MRQVLLLLCFILLFNFSYAQALDKKLQINNIPSQIPNVGEGFIPSQNIEGIDFTSVRNISNKHKTRPYFFVLNDDILYTESRADTAFEELEEDLVLGWFLKPVPLVLLPRMLKFQLSKLFLSRS